MSDVELYTGGGDDLEDRVATLLRNQEDRLTRSSLHKAASDEVEPSEIVAEAQMQQAFVAAGALQPPYPPEFFIELQRVSNILRQNIDAYATNIDGFGATFDPVLDLDSDDAWRLVEAAVREELADHVAGMGEDELNGIIEQRLDRYRGEMAAEAARLRGFFQYAGLGMSFVALRKATRRDTELIGFGGWEVLRNKKGQISKFVRVPAFTLRLMPIDRYPVRVIERQRQDVPWLFEDVPVWRYFRRFVHYKGGNEGTGRAVYLKDFCDPRTVSRSTGGYYASVDEMRAAEGQDAQAANEMIYYQVESMDQPYGEPRWLGNMLSALGSRSAEEVNYLYFNNKSIPPLVLLISGGNVRKEDAEAIEKRMEDRLKGGTHKFHRIMVIAASSSPTATVNPTIELKPLTDAMNQDGLFANYDEANRNKVSESFLIPPLLRGVTKDFNRATAESALRFAESQVFQGMRDEFDFLMNTTVLSELGVVWHTFRSLGPPLRDPETVVLMVKDMTAAGVITPAEARRELASVGFKLEKIDEAWTRRPLQVTAMGVGFEPEHGERIVTPADVAVATEDGVEPVQVDGEPDGTDDDALRALEESMHGQVKRARLGRGALQRLNREAMADGGLASDE
jgi:PBSX family phage portal protein